MAVQSSARPTLGFSFCIASIPELDRSRVRSIKASLVAWAGNLTQPELSMLLSKEGGGIPPLPMLVLTPPKTKALETNTKSQTQVAI